MAGAKTSGPLWLVKYDTVMSQLIPAIFDSGVFRPLAPVDLPEGTRVEIAISSNVDAAPAYDKDRWMKFIEDMEAIPDDSPADGFSNRDHDRLIYGA